MCPTNRISYAPFSNIQYKNPAQVSESISVGRFLLGGHFPRQYVFLRHISVLDKVVAMQILIKNAAA